jgi:serine/threonine protein kinase
MEKLGTSLSDLFYKHGKRFSLKTTLILADQMIKRLQTMHTMGILHRDIKPGNFVMGLGENTHKVYLLDFGLANFFRNPDGSHMGYRTDAPFRGTHRYASVNAHFKVEQSRRDDLEGLGYVLIYFLRGGLPWQNINCSRRKRRKMIGAAKKHYSLDLLCKGLPPEFKEYMQRVRAIPYAAEPPYRFLRKLFKRCFRREGYKRDYIYDWTKASSDAPSTTSTGTLVSQGASESSLSTLSDDGIPRPRYDPAGLKRILEEDKRAQNGKSARPEPAVDEDEDNDMQPPAAKRQRTLNAEVESHTNNPLPSPPAPADADKEEQKEDEPNEEKEEDEVKGMSPDKQSANKTADKGNAEDDRSNADDRMDEDVGARAVQPGYATPATISNVSQAPNASPSGQ